MSRTIRAAAAQFHVGNDIDANLATCVRMIRAASDHSPDLLVLPEFSNHCSWYNDAAHCYEVSVDLDGPFLDNIATAVRELAAHTVINCTVRRDGDTVTGTSILLSPEGEILGTTDKQVLIGHENDFLQRATAEGPIIDTPLGRLAMYSCMDGVISETPRCLALRGAQVLCNSLNSFASDEGSLHIPVRAAENRVWVVAANKVGPLIPAEIVEPVSQAINIPAHMLDGAGDSQIVAPDGQVLAMAGKSEEIVSADIEVSAADDKSRSDGTDICASRRPTIYKPLGDDPLGQAIPEISGPADVLAAAITLADPTDADEAIEKSAAAVASGARLVCLPAMPSHNDSLAQRIASVLGDAIAALAVVEDQEMTAMLVNAERIALRQRLIHTSARHGKHGADEALSLETPQGRIAVMHSDDAIYPEIWRLLALQGVSTVLIPGEFLEDWESATGLVERSAENRVNVVAATHSGTAGNSLVCSLQKDFTIMTEWAEREFDGLLSAPVIHNARDGEPLLAEIHPLAAANKECSQNTHVVASRPWNLLAGILAT